MNCSCLLHFSKPLSQQVMFETFSSRDILKWSGLLCQQLSLYLNRPQPILFSQQVTKDSFVQLEVRYSQQLGKSFSFFHCRIFSKINIQLRLSAWCNIYINSLQQASQTRDFKSITFLLQFVCLLHLNAQELLKRPVGNVARPHTDKEHQNYGFEKAQNAIRNPGLTQDTSQNMSVLGFHSFWLMDGFKGGGRT